MTWLTRARVTCPTPDALVDEVKKARGKKKPLTVADLKRLREEQGRSIVPLQALAAEARGLEWQVAELVNAVYGLTPADVALIWKTALRGCRAIRRRHRPHPARSCQVNR
jgi:hypothetical protein